MTWSVTPGADHGGMTKDGYKVALPAGFDPQHAEAVLGIVKRDPVDQTGQDLRRARCRCPHHLRRMEEKVRRRHIRWAGSLHLAIQLPSSQGYARRSLRRFSGSGTATAAQCEVDHILPGSADVSLYRF